MKKYILSRSELMYTEKTANEFMENVVPELDAPVIFQKIVKDYVTDMTEQGYKPATIDARKILQYSF